MIKQDFRIEVGDYVAFDYLFDNSVTNTHGIISIKSREQGIFLGYAKEKVSNTIAILLYKGDLDAEIEASNFHVYYFFIYELSNIEKQDVKIDKGLLDSIDCFYTKLVMTGNQVFAKKHLQVMLITLYNDEFTVLKEDKHYLVPDLVIDRQLNLLDSLSYCEIDDLSKYERSVYLNLFATLREIEPRIVIVRDNRILNTAEHSEDENFFMDNSCFPIVKKMIDDCKDIGIDTYLAQQNYVPEFSDVETNSILSRSGLC